ELRPIEVGPHDALAANRNGEFLEAAAALAGAEAASPLDGKVTDAVHGRVTHSPIHRLGWLARHFDDSLGAAINAGQLPGGVRHACRQERKHSAREGYASPHGDADGEARIAPESIAADLSG